MEIEGKKIGTERKKDRTKEGTRETNELRKKERDQDRKKDKTNWNNKKGRRNEPRTDRKNELGGQTVQPCFSASEFFCNPSCSIVFATGRGLRPPNPSLFWAVQACFKAVSVEPTKHSACNLGERAAPGAFFSRASSLQRVCVFSNPVMRAFCLQMGVAAPEAPALFGAVQACFKACECFWIVSCEQSVGQWEGCAQSFWVSLFVAHHAITVFGGVL